MSAGDRLLQMEPSSKLTSYCSWLSTLLTAPASTSPSFSTYTWSPSQISTTFRSSCRNTTWSTHCRPLSPPARPPPHLCEVVLVADQARLACTVLTQQSPILGTGHMEGGVASLTHTLHTHPQAPSDSCQHRLAHSTALMEGERRRNEHSTGQGRGQTHTNFLRERGMLEVRTGSFRAGSSSRTSGMLTAHTRWAHFPEEVGFRAPPRNTHRQHSWGG